MQSYFITFKSWYFEFKTFWGPADTLKLNWRKLFVFKLEVCVELIHMRWLKKKFANEWTNVEWKCERTNRRTSQRRSVSGFDKSGFFW